MQIKYTVWRIQSIVLSQCGTISDGCWTYGGHFFRYLNVEQLYCTPKTDLMLYISYFLIKIKKNKIHIMEKQTKKIQRGLVSREGRVTEGDWVPE